MPEEDALVDRKRRYESELERLLARIERLQSDAKAIKKKLTLVGELMSLEAGTPASSVGRVRNRREDVVNAAIAALQRLARPTHYRDIAEQIEKDGFQVYGKDPAANILSIIYKHPKFVKGPKEGLYGLAEWGETISSHPDS